MTGLPAATRKADRQTAYRHQSVWGCLRDLLLLLLYLAVTRVKRRRTLQLQIAGVAKQLRFDAAARWPPSWPAVAGEMLPSEPSRSFSRHTVQRHWSTFISTALRSKALRARIAGGYSARSKCAPATKQPRTPAVTTNAVQRLMHVLLVDLRRVGVRSHIDAAACYCQPNTPSILPGDCTGLIGPVLCLGPSFCAQVHPINFPMRFGVLPDYFWF